MQVKSTATTELDCAPREGPRDHRSLPTGTCLRKSGNEERDRVMYPRECGYLIRASVLVALMLSPLPSALAGAQTVQAVDAAVVGRGVRASKLIGSTVRIDRDERIGSIDDIIIDEKGQLYAILEV